VGPRATTTLFLAAAAWLILVVLPDPAALAVDLRILHTSYLPADPAGLVRLVLGYAVRSDGALPASLGLIAVAAVATAIVVARRDRLTLDSRVLAGAALGWLVTGAVTLLVVTYRPSRYVVPLLPALSILIALGWAAATRPPTRAAVPGSSATTPARRSPGRRSIAALAAIAVGALVVPGILEAIAWSGQPSTLPAIQADALGAGIDTPIEGKMAPAFAMRVAVPAIVSLGSMVNGGDLYADRGVRWVVAARDDPTDTPGWAATHPQAWAARRAVACHPWSGTVYCLYRVP